MLKTPSEGFLQNKQTKQCHGATLGEVKKRDFQVKKRQPLKGLLKIISGSKKMKKSPNRHSEYLHVFPAVVQELYIDNLTEELPTSRWKFFHQTRETLTFPRTFWCNYCKFFKKRRDTYLGSGPFPVTVANEGLFRDPRA